MEFFCISKKYLAGIYGGIGCNIFILDKTIIFVL